MADIINVLFYIDLVTGYIILSDGCLFDTFCNKYDNFLSNRLYQKAM